MAKTKYRTGEKALTPKQQELLISASSSYLEELFFKTALALGCRRADIIRLRWDNINLAERSVSYLEAKKGDSVHVAYIPESLVILLKRWRENTPGPYLFPGKSEGHISSKTAYNIFNRAMGRAGLPTPWPFHSLRATAIKNCQRAGWSPEATAILVNDTLQVIQQHYTIPSLEERRAIAQERPIV